MWNKLRRADSRANDRSAGDGGPRQSSAALRDRDADSPGPSRHYVAFALLVWPLQALFARIRVPAPPADLHERAWLCVANHRSMFDVMIGVTLFRRWRLPVAFLVHERYFENRFYRPLLRMIGGIPVDQRAPLGAVKTAVSLLEAGTSVMVMPEGMLAPAGSPRDALLPIGPGAALIARKTGVSLIVGGVHGSDDVWPADHRFPAARPWRRATVTVGIDRLDPDPDWSRDELNERVTAAMGDVLRSTVASVRA